MIYNRFNRVEALAASGAVPKSNTIDLTYVKPTVAVPMAAKGVVLKSTT